MDPGPVLRGSVAVRLRYSLLTVFNLFSSSIFIVCVAAIRWMRDLMDQARDNIAVT